MLKWCRQAPSSCAASASNGPAMRPLSRHVPKPMIAMASWWVRTCGARQWCCCDRQTITRQCKMHSCAPASSSARCSPRCQHMCRAPPCCWLRSLQDSAVPACCCYGEAQPPGRSAVSSGACMRTALGNSRGHAGQPETDARKLICVGGGALVPGPGKPSCACEREAVNSLRSMQPAPCELAGGHTHPRRVLHCSAAASMLAAGTALQSWDCSAERRYALKKTQLGQLINCCVKIPPSFCGTARTVLV